MAMIKHDPENPDAMRDMFGPHHVDQTIRQAISVCWMSLPKEKRNTKEVEDQVRRILDRAIMNMHEDASQFGFK